MRDENPTAMSTLGAAAAVALVTLTIAFGVAFSVDEPSAQSANNPAAAPETPAAVTTLNHHEVEGILGRQVLSSADENMGRIVDLLIDRSGQVRAAVIDFGGFLGVGSRKIAVDWKALHFPPPGETGAKITLEFTRDQVKSAPEFLEGKPAVVLSALGTLETLPFD